jgi:ATP-dependent DNA helicase PIF1
MDDIVFTPKQEAGIVAAKAGENVFFTGPAGSGKSAAIKKLIRELPGKVGVVASTGVAAVNIGGSTIYSWAGIGLGKDGVDDIVDKLKKMQRYGKSKKIENPGTRIATYDTLIIDEISMLPKQIFDKLDKVFRIMRAKTASPFAPKNHILPQNKPFGGMQLILVGDFFQLPPVHKDVANCEICGSKPKTIREGKKVLYECSQKKDSRCETAKWDNILRFCFDADVNGRNLWDECEFSVQILDTVHRQDEPWFVQFLNRLRVGAQTPKDIEQLMSRCGKNTIDVSDGIKPTVLYTHNMDVDEQNQMEYKAIDDLLEVVYLSKKLSVNRHTGERNYHGSRLLDMISKGCPAKETQALKVGTQVMLVANLSVADGLCNGTRGVVIGFSPAKDVKKQYVQRMPDATLLPRVRFFLKSGEYCDRIVKPNEWEATTNDECATFTQIPLVYGWATTIHKSQGMTLTKVIMSLDSAFAEGQVYVALSRAARLEGCLWVQTLDPRKIKVHPAVHKFYLKHERKHPSVEELAGSRNKRIKLDA